jgi:tetratricopeptide (TPR) repeat protein
MDIDCLNEVFFSTHSPVQSFHEWGARINAALKKKSPIPEWITYVLAGTYWRIWGHPQNGLECYKNALAKAPKKYLDIVLTNLAGLLYKSGSVSDAIIVLQDAVAINDKEPGTNFFLANMYSLRGEIHLNLFWINPRITITINGFVKTAVAD